MSDSTAALIPLGRLRDSYDLLGYEWDDSLQGYVVYCNNTGFRGTIEVPAEYNRSPVLGVKQNGFASSNATAIILPEGLTCIYSGALACQSLRYLYLPDSVTSFSSSWCTTFLVSGIHIPSLRLPKSLTHVTGLARFSADVLWIPETIKDVEFFSDVDQSIDCRFGKIFFEGKPDEISIEIQGNLSTFGVDELYVAWSKGESPSVRLADVSTSSSVSFEEAFPNSKIYYNYKAQT